MDGMMTCALLVPAGADVLSEFNDPCLRLLGAEVRLAEIRVTLAEGGYRHCDGPMSQAFFDVWLLFLRPAIGLDGPEDSVEENVCPAFCGVTHQAYL